MAETEIFKRCPSCLKKWRTRGEFIGDEEVRFLGYQAFFMKGTLGLFLFNHLSCQTTLAISAAYFEDLKHFPTFEAGPEPIEPRPSYCLTAQHGRECPSLCECRFVQYIVQTLFDKHP